MGNSGIIVSGGSFNAQQVAVGEGASINNAGPADIGAMMEAIASLRSAVAETSLTGAQHAEINAATAVLESESKAPEPDRTRFDQALHCIEKSAAAVPAITGALLAIQSILPRLFGG